MIETKEIDGYKQYKIKLKEGNFEIIFGGNLDLYWTIFHNSKEDKKEFLITKGEYYFYNLLERLFEAIKSSKPLGNLSNKTCDSDFIASNSPFIDGHVEWLSDEFDEENASVLYIYKEDETYKIVFQKSKECEFFFGSTYSIRFRNSGSRYNPFNSTFMVMYNELGCLDLDQIHIEEYMYQKKLEKLN